VGISLFKEALVDVYKLAWGSKAIVHFFFFFLVAKEIIDSDGQICGQGEGHTGAPQTGHYADREMAPPPPAPLPHLSRPLHTLQNKGDPFASTCMTRITTPPIGQITKDANEHSCLEPILQGRLSKIRHPIAKTALQNGVAKNPNTLLCHCGTD
jgi:hypothetical protein